MGFAVPEKYALCIAALQAAKSRCAVAACTPSAEGVPTVLHQQIWVTKYHPYSIMDFTEK